MKGKKGKIEGRGKLKNCGLAYQLVAGKSKKMILLNNAGHLGRRKTRGKTGGDETAAQRG